MRSSVGGLDALVGWLVLEEEVLRVSVHPTVYGLRCLSHDRDIAYVLRVLGVSEVCLLCRAENKSESHRAGWWGRAGWLAGWVGGLGRVVIYLLLRLAS